MTTDDEGPMGAALAMLGQIMEDRNGPQGWWTVAQLRALVVATMKRDAALICHNCAEAPDSLYQNGHGGWMHREVEAVDGVGHRERNTPCLAANLQHTISELERASLTAPKDSGS